MQTDPVLTRHTAEKEAANQPENSDFSFEHKGVYTATGWGHAIGLKVEYPVSSLERIEIKINKPMHMAERRAYTA